MKQSETIEISVSRSVTYLLVQKLSKITLSTRPRLLVNQPHCTHF